MIEAGKTIIRVRASVCHTCVVNWTRPKKTKYVHRLVLEEGDDIRFSLLSFLFCLVYLECTFYLSSWSQGLESYMLPSTPLPPAQSGKNTLSSTKDCILPFSNIKRGREVLKPILLALSLWFLCFCAFSNIMSFMVVVLVKVNGAKLNANSLQ